MSLLTCLLFMSCGTPRNVVALGDSITQGYPGVGNGVLVSYPTQLFIDKAPGWQRVLNGGVVGDTAAGMLSRWTSTYRNSGATVLILLGGINDIRAGTSGATTFTSLKTILDQANADGLTVIRCTVLPFKGDASWSAGTQTELDDLNSRITAYAGGGILLDLYGSMGGGGGDARALAVAYDWGDHLHITTAGQQFIATTVEAASP